MNRIQLAERYRVAVNRHWRTMIDNGGKLPEELVDELTGIADEHAQDIDSTTLGAGDYDSSEMAPVVAAIPESTGTQPSPSSVARTRTRTRRNTG